MSNATFLKFSPDLHETRIHREQRQGQPQTFPWLIVRYISIQFIHHNGKQILDEICPSETREYVCIVVVLVFLIFLHVKVSIKLYFDKMFIPWVRQYPHSMKSIHFFWFFLRNAKSTSSDRHKLIQTEKHKISVLSCLSYCCSGWKTIRGKLKFI